MAGMGLSAACASANAVWACRIRAWARGSAVFFCFGVPLPFSNCGRARSAAASSACAALTVLRAVTPVGLMTIRVSGPMSMP